MSYYTFVALYSTLQTLQTAAEMTESLDIDCTMNLLAKQAVEIAQKTGMLQSCVVIVTVLLADVVVVGLCNCRSCMMLIVWKECKSATQSVFYLLLSLCWYTMHFAG